MTHSLCVSETLQGKHLLITGVSGFLGKALLEKLLRTVPALGTITVLLRPSREGLPAKDRFWQEIYPSSVFDRLKEEQGEEAFRFFCEQQVRPISGEITQSRFGLEAADYEVLCSEVDLVINSAASVDFREPLDQALQINTLSLLHMVDFLDAAGHIPLVHVSTCYVHGYHRGGRDEQPVEAFDEEAVCDFAGTLDESALIDRMHDAILTARHQSKDDEAAGQALIDLGIDLANKFGWNDTYTFTKWLGEQLLLKHLAGKSLTIVRPSIIESARKDPVPGWIEGVKVADALTLAFARRRFSLFPARRKGVLDVIPVDCVANALVLAAAEQLAIAPVERIYQVCSGSQSPVTLGEYIDVVVGELREHWERFPRLTRQRAPRNSLTAVHRGAFLTAMQSQKTLLKTKLRLNRGDEKVIEKLKSVDITLKLATIYSFYTNPHYVFQNNQLQRLLARFEDKDQRRYDCDIAGFDWSAYLRKVHLPGLERFGMTAA